MGAIAIITEALQGNGVMINMKAIKITLAVLAAFALLAFAGTSDYTEQVVNTMEPETYQTIKKKLGDGCTSYQIVQEYKNNRNLYK